MKNDKILIKVYQQDWIPGFAAYAMDDMELNEDAKPHILLNLGSILGMVEDKTITPEELPYIVAECIMHEVIHVLEHWAGIEFNEERVERLLDEYRKQIGK